ncbi:MAG: CarD family transcriptional regulator [Eubacteriales bacterium]|nr:CarD family transcriptional regulator [Eubacteriales bacterium]
MEIDFCKGGYVVYGSAGVCYIEDIRNMRFPSERGERCYYILRPVRNASSTLYVPVDNEKLREKMRHVLTKEEIDAILEENRDKEIQWQSDKKKREEEFRKILKERNQKEMLLLVSCIYLKKRELISAGKKLNYTDEGILQEAERCIDDEFSFALRLPAGGVGAYIRERLEILPGNFQERPGK